MSTSEQISQERLQLDQKYAAADQQTFEFYRQQIHLSPRKISHLMTATRD